MDKQYALALRDIGADPLPENAQWKNRMHIRSESSDRLYVVAQNKATKQWACSCMGWKRWRTCKHLTTMVPALDRIVRAGLA